MKKEHIWVIDFYVRDPFDNEMQAYLIKVKETDLQHAITKACHLIDEEYKHIYVQYFIHNAGLADNEENENKIMQDPIGDPYDIEWY